MRRHPGIPPSARCERARSHRERFRDAMRAVEIVDIIAGRAGCLLCGRTPARTLGVWFPSADLAGRLGRRRVPYALCRRCGVRPDPTGAVEGEARTPQAC